MIDSSSPSSDDASGEHAAYSLTKRQREIACLLAQGLIEREIADRLYLSYATVHEHVRHIYDRLGVRTRAEFAAAIVRSGLCDPPK